MGKKLEILIVEDNQDDVELAQLAFEKANLVEENQIHVVKDGIEALEYLFDTQNQNIPQLKHTPNLIILDLRLPKVDGLELLKKIKSHPEMKHVPTVVLSGSKNVNDWIKSYDLGAECYLHKTADFDQLVEAVGLALFGAVEKEEFSGG